MATSVKMREADKARLDRLQAEITARTGRKVSQQDLLARLVALGEREKDRVISEQKPPTKAQMARLMALPMDMGIRTREEDIDKILYGEKS